jgi:hypothetical protein
MIRIYKHENEKPLYEIYINIRLKSGRRTQKRIRGFKTHEEAKRAEAKILVGSIKMDLESYKNLKNPLSLVHN